MNYEERKQAVRERKERDEAEVRVLFPERVKQVAAALGFTARFTIKGTNEAFHRCYAVLENGNRAFSLSTQEYSPDFRFSISGDYDTGPSELSVSSHGIDKPSITVSMRRDAAAIAKEITSRFLPGYDAACAKIAERVKQATDSRDSKRSTIARLAATAGVEMPKKRNQWDDEPFAFHKYYGSTPYTEPKLEVKVRSGSVTIEIDCGVELAAKIIAAMEQHAKK